MSAPARPGWWQKVKHRPFSFAARLALALFAIAILGHLAFFAAFVGGRAPDLAETLRATTIERLAATAELLARVPAGERELVRRAVETPFLQVRLAAAPPFADAREDWAIRRLHRWLPGALQAAFGDRPFRLRHVDPWDEPPTTGTLPYPGSALEIALPQPGLGWVVFTVAADLIEARRGFRLIGFMLIAGLGVAVVAIVAGRRMAAPLRRLAGAAERLGDDLAAPPLPETGSRELRQAARAFNGMQARLRRYVEDRMQMLAAISHDLRTALTRLRLRIELIDDPEQRAKAEADLAAMYAMLETGLSFARAEARGEAKVPVELAALVETACEALEDAGHTVALAPAPKVTLRCRPVALRRALDNLLLNAVRYGGRADVELAVVPGMVEIRVGDRGPGIPPQARERVFEPFYRLEPSRSVETGGAGLGLAVARGIARDHGGDILLEDRPGGGLLARLLLPTG